MTPPSLSRAQKLEEMAHHALGRKSAEYFRKAAAEYRGVVECRLTAFPGLTQYLAERCDDMAAGLEAAANAAQWVKA